MQTTFWMTLQKILNYLWHKIKIKAVYIYNSKLCGWPLELNLSGFNPQLFPFSGNWDKTLARIGKLQCTGSFATYDQLCPQLLFQCLQTMT